MENNNPYLLAEIESEIKKSNGFFWGVFSNNQMYIADKEFNILKQVNAFNSKTGNFSKEATKLMEEYSILKGANMRTEANIEELKKTIILSASLIEKYNKRINKSKNG